jgi:hypothetical protein
MPESVAETLALLICVSIQRKEYAIFLGNQREIRMDAILNRMKAS